MNAHIPEAYGGLGLHTIEVFFNPTAATHGKETLNFSAIWVNAWMRFSFDSTTRTPHTQNNAFHKYGHTVTGAQMRDQQGAHGMPQLIARLLNPRRQACVINEEPTACPSRLPDSLTRGDRRA